MRSVYLTDLCSHRFRWLIAWVLLCVVVSFGTVGCATHATSVEMIPQRYRLEVTLDPPSHHISGRAVIDMSQLPTRRSVEPGPVAFDLLLNPALHITDMRCSGATVKRHFALKSKKKSNLEPKDDTPHTRHRVILTQPVDSLTLFVKYAGSLYQDVSAGEKAGEIHNFKMQAHIAPEGIFLAGGYWYPQLALDDLEVEPLVDYSLVADDVEGMTLIASGESDPAWAGVREGYAGYAWRSPYPTNELVLVGGPLTEHVLSQNTRSVRAYLKPEHSHHAKPLLQAVNRYFDRYEPLIGDYPGEEFSIVSNFFSSGFAFPMFTLLSSAVIEMGDRAYDTHGYLDHELLHSWWGNGILVDPRDGNWCESLTSYAANYYGYVLDGKAVEARRKRRNYSHFLSRIKSENDKPLGTYGLDNGCGRGIAYQKGAAVFHMLARQMGQDAFWSAMRSFTRDYVGRYASWYDIRTLCEAQAGRSFESFFRQWVRSGGAPTLRIDEARYDSSDQMLTLIVRQGEPAFNLPAVPVRVTYADGVRDIELALSSPIAELNIPIDVVPTTVEIDPDYQIFRKVPLDDIIPTTASTRAGDALMTVLPAGTLADGLAQVQSVFESSYDEKDRYVMQTSSIEQGALASRCVLILGEAVRDPYVEAFLSAIEFPVHFSSDGFEYKGVAYTSPADGILITVRHPGVVGGGVTIVYGNSDEAAPKASLIPFYEHSVVIFKNRRAVSRHDIELHHVVTVDRS